MTKNQKISSQLAHRKPETFEIHIDTVDTFLGEEDRPLFIAVLRRDHDLVGIIRQLEDIASAFEKQDILVCYTLDDLLPYFMNRFGIGGTPTFLMISSGVIAGTLLGKNDTQAIVHFIRQNLAHYRKRTGTGKTHHISESGRKAARQR